MSRARPIGYIGKENGTSLAVHVQSRTTEGELVNEQWMTSFFRKQDTGGAAGEPAPDHRFDESLRAHAPVAKVAAHVDEDQTFRYSPASGDPMPIHLDEDIASRPACRESSRTACA